MSIDSNSVWIVQQGAITSAYVASSERDALAAYANDAGVSLDELAETASAVNLCEIEEVTAEVKEACALLED